MSTWAVVVAAGRGERLAQAVPKAFAPLGGRPLLAESLERLDASDWIDAIVVVVPEGWEEPAILLAEELGLRQGRGRRSRAGETRAESVRLGVAEGPTTRSPSSSTTRPARSSPTTVLERVLTALGEGWDGAVPGIPVADTIKRVEGDGVVETLPRDELVAVQTPQAFAAVGAPRRARRRRRRRHRLRVARRGARRACEGRRGRPPAPEGHDRRTISRSPSAWLARREGAIGVIVDYHLHLRDDAGDIAHRADAVVPFVETALARGVDEIGFTEHVYYFTQTARDLGRSPYSRTAASTTSTSYCDAMLDGQAAAGCPSSSGSRSTTSARSRSGSRSCSPGIRGTSSSAPCTGSTTRRVDMSPGVWDE